MTAQVLSPMISTSNPMSIPSPSQPASQQQQEQSQRYSTLLSPVDRDGSYLFDKVIKSGWLYKRTRKTKNWKKRWFVLRRDRLSWYKDQKEYKVHSQIHLSEITAAAVLKDSKRDNVFGLFSPSRNYYMQAETPEEAAEWVELIRKTAALVEGEEELLFSPNLNDHSKMPEEDDIMSSPELAASGGGKVQPMGSGGLSTQTLEYSGLDMGSCSSLSDGARISQLSLSPPDPPSITTATTAIITNATTSATPETGPDNSSKASPAELEQPKQGVIRHESGLSKSELDQSKTVWHGYLYCLKSKGGVKQWKKLWVVLRPVNIIFYKSEEEYRAIKVIPLESVIDIVEIDPLSKSKKFCMQIITEEKSYRMCAPDEPSLAKWLGAAKVTLAKHRNQDHIPI